MVMSGFEPGAFCCPADAAMLFKMFSTLVAVRSRQNFQVLAKQLFAGVPTQESKKFTGKSVSLLQPLQQAIKVVAATGRLPAGSAGTDVRLVQFSQVS